MQLMKHYREIILYLPEAFEWLILKSGVIVDSELGRILASPIDYIESQSYFSWEPFFTVLLVGRTKGTYFK